MAQTVDTHDSRAVARDETRATAHPNRRWRLSWRWLHKWGGIVSALWLALLGVTGFFLDHRDWRLIWQTSVPESVFPGKFLEETRRAEFTIYQINPWDAKKRVAGGRRGLWTSSDGGGEWKPCRFEGMTGAPQALALIGDPLQGWNRLYAATDDGVWVSSDGGLSFQTFALQGKYINAISYGHGKSELLCVVDRSRIIEIDSGTGAAAAINLKPAGSAVAAGRIGFSRFVHDLHFGRGLVSGLGSILVNDLGGVMMLLLPLTGILFWLAPLRWKGREAQASHDQRMSHRLTMKVLHRSHGLYFGLISIIPIIYLSLTGIILDHRDALNDWMKKIQISKAYLTPVYEMSSWNGEIQAVMGYQGDPAKFSLGARSGLYTTTDGGKNWSREQLPGPPSCYVWSVNRLGDQLFVGGMGCPNSVMSGKGGWKPVQGAGHMPVSVAMQGNGTVSMLSHGALYTGDFDRGFSKTTINLPRPEGEPLFTLLDGLHSGLIFSKHWIWVNDAVSVLAISLCVSGLIRLWRSRRIIARDFQTAE
ncbi:MAG: PepSY domain-containing protein, partial [Nitrospinota bacterium]|nr:PepSY domain-containing protein [Nitrospinota bacterium]